MKKLSLLLVLLMLQLCVTVPALAGNDVKGVRYRVNITMPAGKDHIYLYDQPSSSNGNNLGRIDNGDYVTGISSVERNGYTWIYCNYDGIKGYIRKNNLVKVSGGSGSSSSSGNSSSNKSSYSTGTVSFSGDVNVRSGPGLDYEVVGSVYQGQTLSYAGETRNDDRGMAWYAVTYNGRKRWVSSRYSTLRGASSSYNSSSNSGSSTIPSSAKDLSDYEYLTVSSKGRGSLVFQQSPGGKSISGHKYYDGDQIYVNIYYRKNGYAVAYDNGVYGYVDASYIDWGNGQGVEGRSTSSSIPAAAKDLDVYDWFTVRSHGRGSLVFQEKPGGKSIKGHKFYDGDSIYVHPDYRKSGYAVAYDNGVFGFVDASYIDWNS